MTKEEKAEKILTIGSQALRNYQIGLNFINLHHHSPSQTNTEEDQWGYKYLYLGRKKRAAVNSNMKCGNWIGELGQKQLENLL